MVSKLACNAAAASLFCIMTSCSAGSTTLAQGIASCQSNPSAAHHLEVYVPSAVVRRVLGIRESETGAHEGFTFSADGQTILVEDNTSIGGVVPLRSGERIALLGQLECNDLVIHWTHHDPSGRHLPGYIEADGRRYQ